MTEPVDPQELIDELEELIALGRKMPLGGGVLVDRPHVYDLIDRLRVAGPSPTVIMGNGGLEEEALRRSEGEARAQLTRAEEEVSRLRRELDSRIGEQGVTKIAEERGREMMAEADQKAQQVLKDAQEQSAERLAQAARLATQQLEEADNYALQLLQRLEEQMALFLENVRGGLTQLESKRGANPAIERYSHEPMSAPADEPEEEPGEDDGEEAEEEPRRFPWLRD